MYDKKKHIYRDVELWCLCQHSTHTRIASPRVIYEINLLMNSVICYYIGDHKNVWELYKFIEHWLLYSICSLRQLCHTYEKTEKYRGIHIGQ